MLTGMTPLWLGLAAGIGLLMWSADRMMRGAVVVARLLGISAVGIGIVIGFGTSAPELLVSALAALGGTPQIAIGNAIGSNIANIGLVLGAVSIAHIISVQAQVMTVKFAILAAATITLGLVLADLQLGLGDGLILVFALILILYLLARFLPAGAEETAEENAPQPSAARAWTWFAGGLLLLLLASHLIVRSATGIAQHFGVSQLLIGLTVVAIGTSLPELAATIASTWKKHHDITVGNILGSNLFNSLGVVGIAALLSPTTLPGEVLSRDFLVSVALTAALWLLLAIFPQRLQLGKFKGLLLLGGFCLYQWLLYREEIAAPVNAALP